jgi:biotin carboxylase
VKPVSLSGSRGVIRADDAESVMAAVARVRRILDDAGEAPDAPLLIERFVPGDEVALEGMLRAGHLEVLAIFDKPDPLNGPYFEETIYVTPSRKPASTLAAIGERATDAARAVGLREGPVHAELRIAGDDVWVLEFAARSIGGLCSRTLRFGTGVRLEELILRHALGLSLDDSQRETAAAGVMMLPIPEGGVLRAVNGRDDVLAVPGITGLELTIHVGRRVRPLPEGDRYLGFLFARAATPDSVEQALRDAHRRLEVVVTPG